MAILHLVLGCTIYQYFYANRLLQIPGIRIIIMEFSDPKPIYQQIADYILEMIISESWKAGARIPSVRELAAEVEVNPNTVARTYAYLSETEIIYNKRGIGYFLSEDAATKAKAYERWKFINEELPRIFEMMNLLDLSQAEFIQLYLKHKENEKK